MLKVVEQAVKNQRDPSRGYSRQSAESGKRKSGNSKAFSYVSVKRSSIGTTAEGTVSPVPGLDHK